MKQTPFLDYAARYWGHHVRESGAEAALTGDGLRFMGITSNLFCATQAEMHEYLHRSWKDCPAGALVTPPLIVAAKFGLREVAVSLLEHGADIDHLHPYPNGNGISALGVPCQQGFAPVVHLLLDAGTDPRKALRHDFSANHRASSVQFSAIVAVLLRLACHSQILIRKRRRCRVPRHSQQHRVAWGSLRSRRSAIIIIIIDVAIRNHKLDPVLNARHMHLKTPLHDTVERNRIASVIMMLEYDPVDGPRY